MRHFLPLALITFAVPALAETPRVVTDLPPVHSLVSQVMGDLGAPSILLDRGADPHSAQLRPSQARMLTESDLLFWVGPEMTPWLARAIDGVGIGGEAIALLSVEGVHLQGYAAGDAHDDHDHGHGHGHDHDQAADDHAGDEASQDHAEADPHAWLDPQNARVWIDRIAADLSSRDPQNADTYATNAARARDGIAALEAEVRDILAPVGDAPIFVFHDAYGYFSGHFGVNVAGSIALGDAAAPGAGRLTEIRATLSHEGAVCVFPEAQHDPRYAEMLVEGRPVRIGPPLDPSGSMLDYGPELYGALLRGMARAIADCVTG